MAKLAPEESQAKNDRLLMSDVYMPSPLQQDKGQIRLGRLKVR